MSDVVRHPIVAELLHRYSDWHLDDVEAEVTLSKWLDKPQYEHPRYGDYWQKN